MALNSQVPRVFVTVRLNPGLGRPHRGGKGTVASASRQKGMGKGEQARIRSRDVRITRDNWRESALKTQSSVKSQGLYQRAKGLNLGPAWQRAG